MTTVAAGDKVTIHLTYTTDDGFVISTKGGGEPLRFIAGQQAVFQPVDDAIIGMKKGEVKKARVPKEQSMPYNEQLVHPFEKAVFPKDIEWEPGKYLNMNGDDGQLIQLLIVEVGDDTVTLDGNPPIAGKAFDMELEILEISQEEDKEA
jgi:FKBP-type peptidyl-prolyl cis-trans isomerase 2